MERDNERNVCRESVCVLFVRTEVRVQHNAECAKELSDAADYFGLPW